MVIQGDLFDRKMEIEQALCREQAKIHNENNNDTVQTKEEFSLTQELTNIINLPH